MNSTARSVGFGLTLKLLDDRRPYPRTEGLTQAVVEMEMAVMERAVMERASDPVLVWEDALRGAPQIGGQRPVSGAPAGVDDKDTV